MPQRTVKVDGVIIETHDTYQGKDGWAELAYEAGSIEFTIVQITLNGDYLVSHDALKRIYEYAEKVVTQNL